MTEWDIQSRSSACTGCRQSFADKQPYHTLLSFGGAGYERRDLCGGCYATVDRGTVLSYWQGEYKMPPPPAPEAIQKDTAETLLRKLCESNDPTQSPARYILAVMLERKRILRHRDTTHGDDGIDLMVYEHAQTGESFLVPDPHLRLDELAHVREQVAALLGPRKNEAEPASGSAPSVT